jgi:hypothetical protein
MNKLSMIALACLISSTTFAADGPLEIRKSDLIQSGYSTDVEVEMVVRRTPLGDVYFIRLGCDIWDANNIRLDTASGDIGNFDPNVAINFIPGHLIRHSFRLPRLASADHVSCGLADADAYVPIVDVEKVTIELTSTVEARITNRSDFRIKSVDFSCRGKDSHGQTLTSNYNSRQGWAPNYTSRPINLNLESFGHSAPAGWTPYEADECWATKVVVPSAQSLR